MKTRKMAEAVRRRMRRRLLRLWPDSGFSVEWLPSMQVFYICWGGEPSAEEVAALYPEARLGRFDRR